MGDQQTYVAGHCHLTWTGSVRVSAETLKAGSETFVTMGEPEKTTPRRLCPACNSPDSAATGQKNGYLLLSCRNCQTLYSSTLPRLTAFYDSYYASHNLSIPPAVITIIDEIVNGLAAYRSNNHFLDLGFGTGSYLSAAASAGWDVSGVEVSTGAFEKARKAGFNVFRGELHEADFPENYFDVVTAVELLEHLAEPHELLKEVVRILRPGGVFWATTPNGLGLSYHLLGLKWTSVAPPEHLQLFSGRGMRLLLANAGFDNIKLQTHGFNPAELVSRLRTSVNDKLGYSLSAKKANGDVEFNRVCSAYEINTVLMQNPTRRTIKRMLNRVLNAVRQGDTLKILASR